MGEPSGCDPEISGFEFRPADQYPYVDWSKMAIESFISWAPLFVKKVNAKKQQIEGKAEIRGTAVTVVVGLEGYDYKFYNRKPRHQWSPSTLPYNVHISMNGPLQMTFAEADKFAEKLKGFIHEAHLDLLEEYT